LIAVREPPIQDDAQGKPLRRDLPEGQRAIDP
jgi:hypothetical protein